MPKPPRDGQMDPSQSFTDFLSAVPPPLVTVLVGLAPFITSVRHVVDIVSWKASWEESWLTIALWWAACLLGDVALRCVRFILVCIRILTLFKLFIGMYYL